MIIDYIKTCVEKKRFSKRIISLINQVRLSKRMILPRELVEVAGVSATKEAKEIKRKSF